MTLLKVSNLKVVYYTRKGIVKAVNGLNFEIKNSEVFGLAGESGCGKSTVALSILRILPANARVLDGSIFFQGRNLLDVPEDEMRHIRWNKISLVFQGAMNAFNPVQTVGNQIIEAIMLHKKDIDKREAWHIAENLFTKVKLDPSFLRRYPHEFSGGMKQRAMIAMALACNPNLIIADEPTTGLDVIVQAEILRLLKDLKNEYDLSILIISHDIPMLATLCDRLAIMYAGELVEYADVRTLCTKPLHPYTRGLLRTLPTLDGDWQFTGEILKGEPPSLIDPPPGCTFHPRCPISKELCKRKKPLLTEIEPEHYVACHSVIE